MFCFCFRQIIPFHFLLISLLCQDRALSSAESQPRKRQIVLTPHFPPAGIKQVLTNKNRFASLFRSWGLPDLALACQDANGALQLCTQKGACYYAAMQSLRDLALCVC